MIYDIRQFRFGEGDVTKMRLSAVFNANEFKQKTRRTKLNVGSGTIVIRINNVIRRAAKDTFININIDICSIKLK